MNETETRAELIDPALVAAGWGVVEGSRIRREKLKGGRPLFRGSLCLCEFVGGPWGELSIPDSAAWQSIAPSCHRPVAFLAEHNFALPAVQLS